MRLNRGTGQGGILSGDNSFINLTKVLLARSQPLRYIWYSKVSDFHPHLEVKQPSASDVFAINAISNDQSSVSSTPNDKEQSIA